MSYEIWNRRLFEFFFKEENIDSLVIIYVDEGLIKDIGKEIGGVVGFVKSIIFVNEKPVHIVERFESLMCADGECESCQLKIPPYFGMICLTILAWTVDAELSGSIYYDRLNGIIKNSLLSHIKSKDIPKEELASLYVPLILYPVGKNANASKDKKFRQLMKKGFQKLEYHTIETLNADLGFYEYRKSGKREYVSIPKAQALINAEDRAGLERCFFDQGIQPGSILSGKRAFSIIANGGLEYLTAATRNRWKDDKNKEIIQEIMCSLVEHWDGSYTDRASISTRKNSPFAKKQSGAYLWPTLHADILGQSLALNARIEFLSQDFPVDKTVKFQINRTEISARRQSGGWSFPLQIQDNVWTALLGSKNSLSINVGGDSKIRFSPKTAFIFEKSPELGGYIPVREVALGEPYFILAHKLWASVFLSANDDFIQEIHYQPFIKQWKVYSADQGLVSLDGLDDVAQRPANRVFVLSGGAKVGHGSRRSFSILVPPKVRLLNTIPNGNFIGCRSGDGEIFRMMADPEEKDLFLIPDSIPQGIMIEIVVCDATGIVQEKYDSIRLKLVPCTMPGEEYCKERLKGIANPLDQLADFPVEFLYQYHDFKILFEGGSKLSKSKENFMFSKETSLPNIIISHALSAIQIYCGAVELQRSDDDLNIYYLGDLEAGQHELIANWHGVEIGKKNFELHESPIPSINIEGAQRAKIGNNDVWFTRSSASHPCIEISAKHNGGPSINIFLNKKHISSIKDESYKLECPKQGSVKLMLRWAGKDLLDKCFLFRNLPALTVELDSDSGVKWKDSNIYNPAHPPNFDVLMDNRDEFPEDSLRCFLQEEPLIIKEDDILLLSYSLPKTHKTIGEDLQFNAFYYGVPIPIEDPPTVNIFDIPSYEIKVEGRELEPNVYTYGERPLFRVHPIKSLAPMQEKKIYLYFDKHKLDRGDDGSFSLPSTVMPKGVKEKGINVEGYWYGEVFDEKVISLIRRGTNRIHFIGGENIAKKGYVYLYDSCPNEVEIEIQNPEDNALVLFGEKGENKAQLNKVDEAKFSLDLYDHEAGKEYIAELRQGDIKLDSRSFLIAGSNWKKIGHYEGEVESINENTRWAPCWFVAKIGKKGYRVLNAGNCPQEMGSCPCKGVKNNCDIKCSNKKNRTKWKDIVRYSPLGIDKEEQQRWNSFLMDRED